MKQQYQLAIDTWEGQAEIDEAVLKANKVLGIVTRLNDIRGGHHLDENFAKQWEQSAGFCRAPYFVYNPWVDGKANFAWLLNNMPLDAKAVFLDVEVRYAGLSPSTYAKHFAEFYNLVRLRWNPCIYTGEWFLSILSSWPTDAYYWWAQYPFEFYPSQPINMTWDVLREKLVKYEYPLNADKVPGKLLMWQFTGDRLILPGNPRIMDVNVFYGSEAEMRKFFGGDVETPLPVPSKRHVTIELKGDFEMTVKEDV